MRAHITSHDYEQLSAYIDGQLADSDRRRLEERLHAQPDLQVVLDELTRTRALLRTAPRRRAPRNFTLTQAMVGNKPPRRASNFLSFFPALSFTSALAALALVVSIAFQLLPGTGTSLLASQPALDTAAPEVAREMKSQSEAAGTEEGEPGIMAAQEAPVAPEAMAAPAEGSAPPVIQWGADMSYGRGGGGGGAPEMGGLGGGMGGGDGMYSGNGALIVPAAPDQDSARSAAEGETAPKAAQADPSISGPGPILGVPAGEQEGEVLDQKLIQGQPEAAQPLPAAENPATEETVQEPAQPNRLLLIQILLAGLAVITGAAAFLVRSRAR